jgi:probable phosphoglycerate mutase
MKHIYPLLLIRHAEAEHHIREITGGWSDTRLTETGVRQSYALAERLSRELEGIPIQLGASNLRRALQTAEIIGHALGAALQVYPPLTDLNNGIAAGKTHSEAHQLALPPSEPLYDWQPYPQAETWRQFFIRVNQFMQEFSQGQERLAVLVTHAATIHVITAWWLGLPVESETHFELAPASISVLRLNRWKEHSIERLNDTAHLHALGLDDPMHL